MKISEIQTVLLAHPELTIDPDRTLADFQDQTGSEDGDRYLAWLREKTLIDDATFREIHAAAPIEVTVLEAPSLPAEPTLLLQDLEDQTPTLTGGPGAQDAANEDDTLLKTKPPFDLPATEKTREAPKRRYRVLGTAGKGGMGTVHVAKDLDLMRRVALKELDAGPARQTGVLGRFLREVQITAQLDHPNVPPVYSLEVTPSGRPAYTMKLVEGKTFRELLDEARAQRRNAGAPDDTHSFGSLLELFLKVCDAIAFAHDKGVLHRDLKPQNLMVGSHHEVYVMDWGLATVHGVGDAEPPPGEAATNPAVFGTLETSGGDETKDGSTMGTPRYMSPEQASGRMRTLDARSDEYALGLILFELATLEAAIEGDTLLVAIQNASQGKKKPFRHAFGDPLPPEIAAVVEKATALRPDDRYASVTDFAADLRRFLRGDAVLAKPDTALQRLGRSLARNRERTAALLGGLVLVLALGTLLEVWRTDRAHDRRREMERRREGLMSAVAAVGDRVEGHFIGVQGLSEGFSSAITHALEHGQPDTSKLYRFEDFRDPKRRPPDAVEAFGGWVSFGYPVWHVAPGVAWDSVAGSARRLVALRGARRRLFADARDLATGGGAARAPLAVALIGLESGLFSACPGGDLVPASYDVREEPWYRDVKASRKAAWTAPHESVAKLGLVVTLGVPLLDDQEKLVGVAAAITPFAYLKRALLAFPDRSAVFEAILLDREGRVLVRTRESEDGLMKPFPSREVVGALARAADGTVETTWEGRRVVAAWDRIAPLDFTLIALADAEALYRN